MRFNFGPFNSGSLKVLKKFYLNFCFRKKWPCCNYISCTFSNLVEYTLHCRHLWQKNSSFFIVDKFWKFSNNLINFGYTADIFTLVDIQSTNSIDSAKITLTDFLPWQWKVWNFNQTFNFYLCLRLLHGFMESWWVY